jgi:hypothetical protein
MYGKFRCKSYTAYRGSSSRKLSTNKGKAEVTRHYVVDPGGAPSPPPPPGFGRSGGEDVEGPRVFWALQCSRAA